MLRHHGKYTKYDKRNPLAIGQCDTSEFFGRRRDMVKQMQYMGNGLQWTGFWVIKEFEDKPNPQMLAPVLLADPYPVYQPRPDTWII